MQEEQAKKLVHALADQYFTKNAPKPNVDVSMCETCGKMTDVWSTGWPKDKKITWKCKDCREKEAREGQRRLELALEEMCDHH
jgi:hypothetical protein